MVKRARIIHLIKTITGGRSILFLIPAAAFLFTLRFAALGWMYDDAYLRLQAESTPEADAYVPDEFAFDPFRGFYVLLDRDPERNLFLKERGIIPWWTQERTYVAFWRPLASFTFMVDFALLPQSPWFFHLQNNMWFAALAWASVFLLRRLLTPAWCAGIAGIAFVFCGAAIMPAAWISNRHTLITLFFAFTTFIFLDTYERKKQPGFLALSVAAFALSLLASEMGVAAVAFILSWALFKTDGSPARRATIVVPFAVTIVVWRLVYVLSGFGAAGSGIYVDPLGNPGAFLTALPLRAPFYLGASLFSLPADTYGFLSRAALPFAAALLALISAGFLFLSYRYAVRRGPSLFFGAGLLFSLIPLCASAPADRHLLLPAFFAAGLLASLVAGATTAGRNKRRRPVFIIFVVLLALKPVSGATGFFTIPAATETGKRLAAALNDFGDDPALSHTDLVIVGPPAIHFFHSLSFDRLFSGLPMPRRLTVLAPGLSSFTVTRTGEQSLLIETDHGYFPPPDAASLPDGWNPRWINPLYNFTRLERIFTDNATRFETGDRITLPGMAIKIIDVTGDFRIKDALFTFEHPLEDESYRFVTWVWEKKAYIPFRLPAVGETRRVEFEVKWGEVF